ncbi:MAG: ABC transporter permease [Acidobacteriota bacterium]
MPYELYVALRYLRAKRKQAFVSAITFISILGVAVGVMALIVAQAIMTGFYEEIRAKIIAGDPHLLVWNAHPGEPIRTPAAVQAVLSAMPGVEAVAPVILGNGLAVGAAGGEPLGVEIRGVDPVEQARLTGVASSMRAGRLENLTPTSHGIVLGVDVADALGVGMGDPVRLIVPQVRLSPLTPPMPRNRNFKVVGIFSTQFYQWDSTRVYLNIEESASFLLPGSEQAVSALQVKVGSFSRIASVGEAAAGLLGERFYVRNVMERNNDFFKALRTERVVMFLAIGLIILVACLNIVSTLILMVMAKVGEIGALVAMGARVRGIVAVFMLQGVIIGLVGTGIGSVLGTALCWVLDTYKLIKLAPEVYFIPTVPFRTGPGDVALAAGLALAVSFIATLYPSYRAARLDPVEALHYE